VVLRDGIGNGGKAQSRFMSSGEGGRRGPGAVAFLGAGQGDREMDDVLAGDRMEPWPLLLAGVSSPWRKGG